MPAVVVPVSSDGSLDVTYMFATGTAFTVAQEIADTLAQAVSADALDVTTVSGSAAIPTAPISPGDTQELYVTGSDEGSPSIPAGYDDVVNGATGPTTLVAAPGSTIISGDGGGNYVETGRGAVDIAVAGGVNVITAGGTSGTIVGGTGSDTINALGSNELIVLQGTDVVSMTGSNDTVSGGAGSETVNASSGTSPVLLSAGSGNAVLIAGSGNDTMASGSAGATMSGGSGNDQFLIEGADGSASASALITNFTSNDQVVFVDYSAAEVNQAFADAQTGSGSAVITLPDGTTVTFEGVDSTAAITPHVSEVSCFLRGTSIRAPDRDILVEHLRRGDRVTSLFVGVAPIVWIGHRHIDCLRHPDPRKVWPVRVAAGAFGEEMPLRDLFLSPDHAVFVDGVLIPVRRLINGSTIAQVPMDVVTYYHLELPVHDVVLAEGLATESYLDIGDRSAFANGGGVARLHPDFFVRAWEAMGCAPLIVTGPELDAVRARLNAQAAIPKPRRGRAQAR